MVDDRVNRVAFFVWARDAVDGGVPLSRGTWAALQNTDEYRSAFTEEVRLASTVWLVADKMGSGDLNPARRSEALHRLLRERSSPARLLARCVALATASREWKGGSFVNLKAVKMAMAMYPARLDPEPLAPPCRVYACLVYNLAAFLLFSQSPGVPSQPHHASFFSERAVLEPDAWERVRRWLNRFFRAAVPWAADPWRRRWNAMVFEMFSMTFEARTFLLPSARAGDVVVGTRDLFRDCPAGVPAEPEGSGEAPEPLRLAPENFCIKYPVLCEGLNLLAEGSAPSLGAAPERVAPDDLGDWRAAYSAVLALRPGCPDLPGYVPDRRPVASLAELKSRCCICLGSHLEVSRLRPCRHVVGTECYRPWEGRGCPLCRAEVDRREDLVSAGAGDLTDRRQEALLEATSRGRRRRRFSE